MYYLRGGKYEEPANAEGVPLSQDKRGKRKRKYRIYQDVIDSMDSLSQTLYRNEKLRQETEQLRNEWIAGVSHDLKTPLSSVKGYAHLLGNPEYTSSAEPVYMLVYKPWFQRIVDNLVANALIHNESGTIVSISVQAVEPSTALLTFSDNGSGIDAETADRLFERYYRGTDTESRTEGSGLGMVFTKALVEAFGGSLEVKTAVGQGTSISITWEAEQPPRF
ncbi:sensor histidine kinase [Brevibacillus formosus]|uniref:sensor histidine kinase n=1 Tax=Brevibacillus formosus TaxID=54913 RepID=UPI003F1B261D